ncbi:Phage terminase large subunit [Rhizobiales bacterium GAS188]|nr:Phage terminase large subunit [Rhizobiales bacterium GAS188]
MNAAARAAREAPAVEDLFWRPLAGPQDELVKCPLSEIFFGGSRGGGKTDGVLGKWGVKGLQFGEHFNAVMFRRTTVSSTDAIDRSKQIFGPLGGKFNETKLTWHLPNGARIAFAYLDSVDDAQEYQGRNLTDAWIEEAGQYPSPEPIFRLFGVLRSAAGVPVQMILTGNPGGPGQGWIRDRYELVPFPERTRILVKPLPDGSLHKVAVIPSRLADNPFLTVIDPAYAGRLQLVGSAKLVRAWLNGDWNAIEGAFFDEWDEARHVVAPFAIPADWLRFRSMDWGSASPFSVGWWAVCGDGHALPDGRVIPRGALIRYREWYGASAPNVGLKLSAEEVACGIKEREAGESIAYGVLDPSAFAESGGPSIAEMMARIDGYKGPRFRKADNARVGQRGAMSGWMAVRARLKGDGLRPMLFVFSTCTALIRTLPLLQHDRDRPEDLDTEMEDHAADETRYACLSRPYMPAPRTGGPETDRSGYSSFKKPERPSIKTL